MNAPTLFDVERGCFVKPACELNLPDGRRGEDGQPRARATDPVTSHEAAVAVKPGNGPLVAAIRNVLAGFAEPMTAFSIAYWVEKMNPHRWDEGSIRSAIARADVHAVDTEGRSPRGQRCIRYALGDAP